MLEVKKESAWQFVTSSSGGVGVEFVVAEGGMIYLQDPSGKQQAFKYGAAGAGLGAPEEAALVVVGRARRSVAAQVVGVPDGLDPGRDDRVLAGAGIERQHSAIPA